MSNLPECLPKCTVHKRQMYKRDEKRMTKEQKWCGAWYDCPEPGCSQSLLFESKELIEFNKGGGDERT